MTSEEIRTIVRIEAGDWHAAIPNAEALCRQAVTCAWRHGHAALGPNHSLSDPQTKIIEVSVLLSDDETVQSLNRDHLGKDKPTNVLSFPGDFDSPAPESEVLLGDVILAWTTVHAEAHRDHKSTDAHMVHLVTHGVLHLLGYDHEQESDAVVMEGLEVECMAQMGLPDPYETTSIHDD